MEKYAVYKEIYDQPKTWEKLISEYENKKGMLNDYFDGFDSFIFSGCGSGYNASVYSRNAGEFFLDRCCLDYQASEICFYGDRIYGKKTLKNPVTFLYSRSGNTTETVNALKYIKNSSLSKTFGITCHEESYLYNNCDLSFSLKFARDEAVVTTKSLTSMALLPVLIFNGLGQKVSRDLVMKMPEVGKDLIERYSGLSKSIGEDKNIDKFLILSNTPNFGLAREMKLKLLEMTVSWADCFNIFDFRHGPRAIVDKNSMVILILSDSAVDHELKLAQEISGQGGKLLILGDKVPEKFFNVTDNIVEIGVNISEWVRGILFLPVIQLISYYRALSRNLNPDSPESLTYFVEM